MTRGCFAWIIAVGLLIGGMSRGEDWPEFRGPTGQGIIRKGKPPPIEWSPTKDVAWKQPIPGNGWSSPVVAEGRVYLTTSVPKDGPENDQSLQALCLDAESGKILWTTDVIEQKGALAPRIHGKNSHASPTPLIQGRRLYVHFGHQGTACLDLSGKVLWRNTGLSYAPVHGNGGSPIIVDDLLVFNCDGGDQRFIVALDCNTGDVRWKTNRSGEADRKFSFSTPLLITVGDQKQIISPASDAVYAYDPLTGREIWRLRYSGYSVVPRPVYGQELVFICTGYDAPSLLAIRPDGQGDVTETHLAWTTRKSVPHTPSLLLVGEELYMVSDSGMASCLDAKTGRVYWQQRIGGNYSASLLYADGKIYFQNEQGSGIVVKASQRFEQLAKNSLEERTLASYAAVDGALFIRTEKNLYRIQGR
jgi:outer membrane protein assembly factor BamB